MAADFDSEDGDLGYDPSLEPVLLDLFTEIAILEHLIRKRLEPTKLGDMSAAEFGVLNYFCRLNKNEERLSGLAWCFQVDESDMRRTVSGVVARNYLTADDAEDPCVRVTDEGRGVHATMIKGMAPDVAPLVAELAPEDVRTAARVLVEIRRTLDNLPDR